MWHPPELRQALISFQNGYTDTMDETKNKVIT